MLPRSNVASIFIGEACMTLVDVLAVARSRVVAMGPAERAAWAFATVFLALVVCGLLAAWA
jgi:hypothetical protein